MRRRNMYGVEQPDELKNSSYSVNKKGLEEYRLEIEIAEAIYKYALERVEEHERKRIPEYFEGGYFHSDEMEYASRLIESAKINIDHFSCSDGRALRVINIIVYVYREYGWIEESENVNQIIENLNHRQYEYYHRGEYVRF